MQLKGDALRFIDSIRANIFVFAERAMNFAPTDQQRELFQAVQDWKDRKPGALRRIACKSGQGPGKTTGSTIIGLWRGLQDVGAKTVVTAPTMRQCRQVWLTECRRRMEHADPWFQRFVEVTKSAVVFANHPHWGVETSTSNKPENAQGHHEEHMTILVEEGSGIARDVWEQWEGTATQGDNMMIAIGNPNTRDSAFFDCFNRGRERWRQITFNAEDTPDWLIDKETHEYLAEKYGRRSDVYRVRVLGEFPLQDPRCIMNSDDLDACAANNPILFTRAPRIRGDQGVARQISLDFARYGSDETAVMRRQGNAIIEVHYAPHEDPNDTVAVAYRMQGRCGWLTRDMVYVPDAGGMGQGMLRSFSKAGKRHMPFYNNSVPTDPQYHDRITEAWFQAADYVRKRICSFDDDPILISQLSSRYYHITNKGKICVESKDDYAKRGFESPGRADAFVMAMYDTTSVYGQASERSASPVIGARRMIR